LAFEKVIKKQDAFHKLDTLWLRFIRLYTFHFPIDKGKGRLFMTAKKFCRHLPKEVLATTEDGRKLYVGLSDWSGDGIFFLGRYESFCTETVSRYIKKGDVCLDVGANIGWFTTLFAKLCGTNGEVHAFEPVPKTFADLQRNVALNGKPPNVFLNSFGLGDVEKESEIHLFSNLPNGHASLAAKPNQKSETVPILIKTLDSYLAGRNIGQVDFIKVDVEGAEQMFLRGGRSIFQQKKPPVIFMEMALENTKEFGYKPNDIISFIKENGDYDFFALDEVNRILISIEGFADDEIGANVLCVLRERV
jgi:FkbM family methyltransferase